MKRKYVTYGNLIDLGFTYDELQILLENNILFKSGIMYSYKNIDELINSTYTIPFSLIDKVLNLCYFVEPDYYRVNLNLFARCILIHKQIQPSLIYLSKLLNTSNLFALQDYNLLLYLISHTCDLDENLKEKARDLKEKDFLLLESDQKINSFEQIQEIRRLIFAQRFKLAKQSLTELSKKEKPTLMLSIIRKLLLYAIVEREKTEKHIQTLLEEDKIVEALKYLEELKSNHQLSNLDYHVKLGLTDILSLKYFKKLSFRKNKSKKRPTINPYAAIESGEYRAAKQLLSGKAASNSLIETLISKVIEAMDANISISCDNMLLQEEKIDTLEVFKTLYNQGIYLGTIAKILGFSKAERNMKLLQLVQRLYEREEFQMGDEVLYFVEQNSAHVKEVEAEAKRLKMNRQNTI